MIVAKLTTEIQIPISVSPSNTEIRVADCFIVKPYYEINRNSSFHVILGVLTEKTINPSSSTEENSKTIIVFQDKKIYLETLTQEELSNWGTNDESLYQIFAEKYNLQIKEFVYLDEI